MIIPTPELADSELSPAQKKDLIERMRKLHALVRARLPKAFCDDLDATLLFYEDVATDEIQ